MSAISPAVQAPNFLDTLTSARQGLDRGVRSFAEVAQAVASDGVQGRVEARHVTDALAARNDVAASARVYQAADQMLGTLLDLRA
ncbi:MAG: hypothetical protein JSR73_13665 [Proteobacteria bacterium]|nr:hypothetical protein [Pseudomonadota bacterium]